MLSFLFSLFLTIPGALAEPAPVCLAGPQKCDGTWTCMNGILVRHSAPISIKIESNLEACKLLCTITPNCTRLIFDTNACILFRDGEKQRTDNGIVCMWTCCQEPLYCRRGGPRCPGYWQRFLLSRLEGGRTYNEVSCADDPPMSILETCRHQPVCAGLTRNRKNVCSLSTFEESMRPNYSNSSEAYLWKCCNHNDRDLDKKCRQAAGKCVGRWRPTTIQPSNETRLVSMFHSLSKFDCLDACAANPFCTQTYFNQTSAICLLKSNVSRLEQFNFCDHTFFNGTENYRWYGYYWECCPEESQRKARKEASSSQCLCFNLQNSSIQVAADDCGLPDASPHMRFVVKSGLSAFWIDSWKKVDFQSSKWISAHNGEFPVSRKIEVSA